VTQLPFHRGLSLLTELAQFLIAFPSRRGQMAELSPRAFLLYLAFLPLVKSLLYPVILLLVKCLLRRREYLVFHVPCHRESGADSSLRWRADSAICPATPFQSGML
jgi:hypothetical protein